MRNGDQLQPIFFLQFDTGNLIKIQIQLPTLCGHILQNPNSIMIQIQHLQIAKLAHIVIDGRDPTVHELQMRIELVEECAITNKLSHAIGQK